MEGAIFGLFLRQMIMGGFHDDYNPWHGRAEKSGSAKHREVVATKKFDYLETQMKMALFENTKVVLGLGIRSNNSPLRLLSSELVDHVMSFVGGGVEGNRAKEVSINRSGLAIIPFEGCHYRELGSKPKGNAEEEEEDNVGINLADLDLYTPGKKISIPLTLPNHHMTGPCYRDLRKHIISKEGWDVKRVAATPEERREYRETRKGKSYFINAVYKVQGIEPKKKRSRKKAPPGEVKPLTAEEEGVAAKALEKAVSSAENDGEVDPSLLKQAVDAGYSKQFVLGKAAERWNEMKDTKPSANKKLKAEK